jgi:hypothetical protein
LRRRRTRFHNPSPKQIGSDRGVLRCSRHGSHPQPGRINKRHPCPVVGRIFAARTNPPSTRSARAMVSCSCARDQWPEKAQGKELFSRPRKFRMLHMCIAVSTLLLQSALTVTGQDPSAYTIALYNDFRSLMRAVAA